MKATAFEINIKEKREMITKKAHRATWAAMTLAALFTFLFGMAPQMTAAELTKKQAHSLAATAKTPADHMKLAAYFKLEADRLDAQASDHEDLAKQYRLNPVTMGGGKSGGNTQGRTFEHCEAIAKSLREAANATRDLASEHEQMAKDASK
jgi:hypothetical protein